MTYPSSYPAAYPLPGVINTWPGTFTTLSGFQFSQPFGAHIEVPVGNADGNWLVALVSWQSPGIFDTTVSVADDAGNNWQPLGAPVGTSSAAGNVRAAIWAAPYAMPAGNVWVSPTGYAPAYSVLVLEVAGLGPGLAMQAVNTGWANAATSASVALPAPSVLALALACAGSDDNAFSITMSGGGWTSLPAVVAANGTDHSADLTLTSGWQVTSGPVTATWTAGGALDLGACAVAVTVTQAAPAGPSQGWPLIQYQAAFGAGINTPWDQLTWTDLTARYRGMSGQRGKQYELDSVQASAMSVTWSNNDGALTPGNTASPYYLGISGWTGQNGSKIALSGAYAWTGSASMQLTPDGVTANPYAAAAQVPVTALAAYSGQAAVLCPSGWTGQAVLSVDWYTAAHAYISTTNGTAVPAPAGQWAFPSISAAAPGTAAFAQLDVKAGGTPPASTLFYWDACYFTNAAGVVLNSNPVMSTGPQVYTPVRQLGTWQGRTYVAWRGFMERWPMSLSSSRYTVVAGTATDIYAGLTSLQPGPATGEILNDEPWGYWPGTDAAGSKAAANKAPTGTGALQVVTSKYGASAAVQAFGANSGAFAGQSSDTTWQQSGLLPGAVDQQHGYCLQLQATNTPPVSAGLTIECWVMLTGSNPNGQLVVWALQGASGTIAKLWADYDGSGGGQGWYLSVTDKVTRAVTTTILYGPVTPAGYWIHFGVTLTPSGWTVTINGGGATPAHASGACNLAATWQWITWGGSADRVSTGGSSNISLYAMVVYPRVVPQPRILAHYSGAVGGLSGDGEGSRMSRLLSYASMLVARRLALGQDVIGPATDIAGQACAQNITNIAQSGAGLLYADRCGYLAFQSRGERWNEAPAWNVGENAGAFLNANWDFESGTSSWAPGSSATVASSSALSFTGQSSMLVTPSAGGASGAVSEQVAVTAGGTYTASAWLCSPGGWAPGGHAQIQWYSNPSTLLSTTTGTTAALNAGQWTNVTASASPPGGATLARLVVSLNGTPNASNPYYADQAVLSLQGEIPYLADVAFDYDPAQIFNDLTISQFGGITVADSSAVSMQQYGTLTLQETVYLNDPDVTTDLANRILADYGQPNLRVASFTVDAAANPYAWKFILSADVGTVVQVSRRLQGTQTVIQSLFVIQSVSPSNAPGVFQVKYTATPYYLGALATNDPVRGLPNGLNPIGW